MAEPGREVRLAQVGLLDRVVEHEPGGEAGRRARPCAASMHSRIALKACARFCPEPLFHMPLIISTRTIRRQAARRRQVRVTTIGAALRVSGVSVPRSDVRIRHRRHGAGGRFLRGVLRGAVLGRREARGGARRALGCRRGARAGGVHRAVSAVEARLAIRRARRVVAPGGVEPLAVDAAVGARSRPRHERLRRASRRRRGSPRRRRRCVAGGLGVAEAPGAGDRARCSSRTAAVAEVASILECGENTVRTHLGRGRRLARAPARGRRGGRMTTLDERLRDAERRARQRAARRPPFDALRRRHRQRRRRRARGRRSRGVDRRRVRRGWRSR